MPLPPLTTELAHKKQQLIDAYSDFWTNIRFRKGWQKPVFQRDEVLHLLDRAAEIVTRKRAKLDENGEFKMRMIDGAAREYLWSVTEHPVLSSDKSKELDFVRNLVHATFKDRNGYVEGLTEKEIDEFIFIIEHELEESLPVTTRIPNRLHRIQAVCRLFENTTIMNQVFDDQTLTGMLETIDDLLDQAETKAFDFTNGFYQLESQRTEHLHEEMDASSEEEEPLLDQACINLRESQSNIPVSRSIDDPIASSIPESMQETIIHPSTPSDVAEPMETDEVKSSDTDLETTQLDKSLETPSEEEKEPDSPQVVSTTEPVIDLEPTSEEKETDSPTSTPSLAEESSEKESEEITDQESEEKQRELEREQQRKEAEQRRLLYERAERKKQQDLAKQEAERINKWKKLKFEPRLDVTERSDGFLITGYIPGLSPDDLKVQVDEKKNTLTISGFYHPSKAEEAKLETKLHNTLSYRYGPKYTSTLNQSQYQDLLLRMGSGIYGSFNETFSIPSYVDFDNIRSSYEGGVLRIAIPVTERHLTPKRRTRAYEPDFFTPSFFSHPMSRDFFW